MIARTMSRLALLALLLVVATAGAAPPTLDTAWGTTGTGPGALMHPGGIADGPDATVYVADTGNDRVQRFAANGALLAEWDGSGGGGTAFDGPTDIAVDTEAGEVYVVDAGNDRVGVYDITGSHLRDLIPADGFDWPYGIALAPSDGTVWVSDMNGNRLVAFPPAGGDQAHAAGDLARPAGIAVALDGDVYVADKDNQRIARLDSGSGTVSTFADGGGAVGAMVEPFDVELDAFGRLHVVDAAYSSIREYAPDGTLADTWTSQTSDDGQADIPRGLTISDGDIAHVADYGDDRIERYVGLNNAPTVTGDSRALLEDDTLVFAAADFTDGYSDADGHAPAAFRVESVPAQGVLEHDGAVLAAGDTILVANLGPITYTPPTDFFGSVSFDWNLSDSVAWAETPATTELTVQPVNDAPSMALRNDPPAVDEDAGEQVVTDWLTLDRGAPNEAGQTLTFTVSNVSDPSAFATLPTVAPDTGTLTYETADDANGDFTFDLQVQDSGGSANGGDPVGPTITDIPITVNPVNDAPTFDEGTSADITIDEDGAPRSFGLELTASDVDGDDIAWGIGTAPAHGTAGVTGTGGTRQITYQPDADYNGQDAFSVVVGDGNGGSAVFTVDLTIAAVNDPPELTGTPPTTVAEDAAYSFVPDASDPDDGDTLSFSIAGRPEWADFDRASGALEGTPTNADVGTYPGVEITVSDASGASATIGPFAIEVTNVNDAPVITNAPPTTVAEDSTYDYVPQVNDPDAGDTATFAIDNAPAWTTFDPGTGRLNGTPDAADVGRYEGIRIRVRDAAGLSDAVGPFAITVTEVDDPPHTVAAPPDLTVDATGLYTRVDLESAGAAMAMDEEDGVLDPEPVDRAATSWLRPGSHTVTWRVTDSGGNTVVDEQTVAVRPRVALGPDRTVQEGTPVQVPIVLNGDPIEGTSPTVGFAVADSSSADPGDYTVLTPSGPVTVGPGRRGTVDFGLDASDRAGEGPETLVLELTGTDGNAVLADRRQATVTIVERNVPPAVSLQAEQGGREPAVLIDGSAGASPVTVTADTTDVTPTGAMRFAWNGSAIGLNDMDGTSDDRTFTFDPGPVAAGTYTIEVVATDTGTPAESGSASLRLRIVDSLPALDSVDTDGDGRDDDDADEGLSDRDGDGLPDYRDPYTGRGTLHQSLADDAGYLLQTDPGLDLALGPVAFALDRAGAEVSREDIERVLGSRDDLDNVGGYFGFTVHGLPTPGAAARVVIPQRAPIPENAVYRKLGTSGGWRDFVQRGSDALASARGASGYCPPPGDPAYADGLTAGDRCVRVTVTDGGPNDADGTANGRIVDPGGVARAAGGDGDGASAEATGSGGGAVGLHLLALLGLAAGWGRFFRPSDRRTDDRR